jgi:hypothetical protein
MFSKTGLGVGAAGARTLFGTAASSAQIAGARRPAQGEIYIHARGIISSAPVRRLDAKGGEYATSSLRSGSGDAAVFIGLLDRRRPAATAAKGRCRGCGATGLPPAGLAAGRYGRRFVAGERIMTALHQALAYADKQLPVFPCRETEPGRKRPYTGRGFHDASCDKNIIEKYWQRWPQALIGMPTGQVSGRVVLDIDVKQPKAKGFDTLEDLGHSILPETPMAHTASGGLHVYFAWDRELRNSTGLIGPGLDIRGDGGYVILPSPDSGYYWDPIYSFDQPLAPAPDWLWPVRPSRPAYHGPVPIPRRAGALTRYGEAAIERACDAIAGAPNGDQERTLNAECFSIGALAGAGAVPAGIALRTLLRAANTMPDHDPHLPWRPEEIDFKVRRAFCAGLAHPREARRAVG